MADREIAGESAAMATNRARPPSVGELADEFLDRYRRGERPSLTEYVQRFPDYADEIRDVFPAMAMLEDFDLPERQEQPSEAIADCKLERLGDYRIIREVGRGGMGVVYEAEQLSLARRVALKVLPQGLLHDKRHRQRFEREARAAARLHHTNIVPVFGVGEQEGLHYYVMQFIPGLGLDEVLTEVRWLRSAASGTLASVDKPQPAVNDPRSRLVGAVAGSLVSGRFEPTRIADEGAGPTGQPTLDFHDVADGASDGPAGNSAASGATDGPRSRGAALRHTDHGRLSETATSSAGFAFPGQSAAQSKSHSRSVYWQSVARIGVQVAEALQYAHEQGIIHRDVKPANLLLDPQGTVWVTDFGLAKAIDQQDLTHTGDVLGTLRYMAPEQFDGRADPRSDQYALGMTLYELLALKPAFDETDRHKLIKQVTTGAPPRLRLLDSTIPRDLETIVHKAIDRDPGHRYQTAGELAADLQRYLGDEAILARQPTVVQLITKWCRRHRGAVAAAFAVLVLAVIGLTIGTVLISAEAQKARLAASQERHAADRALQQEQVAVAQSEAAEKAKTESQQNAATAYRQQYQAEMRLGLVDWEAANVSRLYQSAIAHLPEPGRADLRGWEWYYLLSLCQEGRILCEHRNVVSSVAWSPDGRHLATTSHDGDAIVWDARTGALIRRFSLGPTLKRGVAWSPDGQRLAWGSVGDENAVRIWDRVSDEIHVLHGHTHSVISCEWSPDGRRLATTAMDNFARIWDAESRKTIHLLKGHSFHVNSAHWIRDGKFLVTVARQPADSVKVWDAETGKLHSELTPKPAVNWVLTSACSEKQLVLGTTSGDLWLVSLETSQTGPKIPAHAGAVDAVAFSPDGVMYASSGADGRVNVWNSADGQRLFTLHGHQGAVSSLAWNPNGKQLASGSHDKSVRLWEIPPTRQPTVLAGPSGPVHSLTWSNDDLRLTSARQSGGSTTTWNRPANTAAATTPIGQNLWEAESPNGRFKAAAFLKEGLVVVRVHDVDQKRDLGELTSELKTQKRVKALVWSPDSSRLAAFNSDSLQVWDIPAMRSRFTWRGVYLTALSWAPDGSRLAVVGGGDGTDNGTYQWMGHTHVFDVDRQTRLIKVRLGSHADGAQCVAWHPDGSRLAAGNKEGLVIVCEAGTGRAVVSAPMHITSVRALDWTPDGRRVVSVGDDGAVKIWDSATGDELLSVADRGERLTAVRWSSDGKQLAVGDEAGRIRVWDASTGYGTFSGAGHARMRSRMHEERARRLNKLEDPEGAIVELSRAIALAPSRAWYRRSRGLSYARLGRQEDALADLNAAVDLDPDDTAILGARVDLYATRGQWKEALPDALRLVELRQSGFERHRLALLYLLLERRDSYRDVCQQIFAGNREPLIVSTTIMGAWACTVAPQSIPNLEEIVLLLREVSARPDQDTQDTVYVGMCLGALLYRVGKTDEAIERLTKASRFWEHDAPVTSPGDLLPAYAWYFLAMAHHDLAHYPEARMWFDKGEAYAKTASAKPAASRESPLPGAIYWNQRVVLEHLQREARTVLNAPKPK